MSLTPDVVIHWIGGLIAFVVLGIVLAGIWSGARRSTGRTIGRTAGWLRSPVFYLLSTVLFIGISAVFWRPLPFMLSRSVQTWMLALGALVYFPGMALVLWGRLALGKMYFVSTGFGVQLFADHRLVTRGPFSIVRHPMYLGLIAAAFGSMFIYHTWTTALYVLFAPFVLLRARREEQLLATEFGEAWQEYCKHVPAFFPRPRKDG